MPGEFISSENFYSMRNEKKKKEGYFAREAKDFVTSVKARLTVAQVVQGVRNGAEVNFDWLCYTILAGWICCNGICNDQDVDIAASMMIEPIMVSRDGFENEIKTSVANFQDLPLVSN